VAHRDGAGFFQVGEHAVDAFAGGADHVGQFGVRDPDAVRTVHVGQPDQGRTERARMEK